MYPSPTLATNLDPTCARAMLETVRAAVPSLPDADDETTRAQHWLATKMLGDLKPTDSVEAMFAAQAAAAHFAAMDTYRRASDPNLPSEIANALRRGANATARLSQEAARTLQRQRALHRGRVRSADVVGRAVAAASAQPSPPPSAAPAKSEPRQHPIHQSATPSSGVPTKGAPAEREAGRYPVPIPGTGAPKTAAPEHPMRQTGTARPTGIASDPQSPEDPQSGGGTDFPAWISGLSEETFATHLASLSIEELLALTDRMADVQQDFLDSSTADQTDPGTAVA